MGINPCPQNYPNLATTNIVREPGGLRDKITAARDWRLPPSPHRLVQAEEHSAKWDTSAKTTATGNRLTTNRRGFGAAGIGAFCDRLGVGQVAGYRSRLDGDTPGDRAMHTSVGVMSKLG